MIRVGVLADLPYVYECALKNIVPSNHCARPGVDSEIMARVLHVLDKPYTLVPFQPYSNNSFFGNLGSDGNYTGVFGALQNGSIDILANNLLIDVMTRTHFGFTLPMGRLQPVFVVRKPQVDMIASLLVPFHNLSPGLWSMFLLSMVCIFITIFGQQYLLHKKINLWDYVQYMFNQGYHYIFEVTVTGKIMLMVSGLVALLLMNLYQGTLLTQLLIPHSNAPFRDAHHVIEHIAQGKYTMLVKGNWYYDQIRLSNLPYYRTLRETLKLNPEHLEYNSTKRAQLLATGKYVYGVSDFKAGVYRKISCDLIIVHGDGVPDYSRAYMYRNDWELADDFNKVLLQNRYYAANIWEKYSLHYDTCPPVKVEGGTPLSLLTLCGVFVLYAGCVLATLIAFCIEKLKAGSAKGDEMSKPNEDMMLTKDEMDTLRKILSQYTGSALISDFKAEFTFDEKQQMSDCVTLHYVSN